MKHLIIVSLLFLTPLSLRAASLSGNVVDVQGTAIPNALVMVRWDPIGLDGVKDNTGTRENKIATTDEFGHFSVELPAGVYDIFVSAAGFSPHCAKITVKTKDGLRYEARLAVSRMITIKLD